MTHRFKFCLSILLLPLFMVGQSQSTKTVDAVVWTDTGKISGTVLQTTRLFRERLLADPFRPAYHFVVPEDVGIPGDPNGAFYANGRYHLMYLYKREGSGFSWGHVSSGDLLHWRHHPDAIGVSGNDDGVFSGGAYVDKSGKAMITYWEFINDPKKEKIASRNTGISIATSMDKHFDNWTKSPDNPAIRSTEWGVTEGKNKSGEPAIYGSADPSNIWMNNGKYYMLTGNLLVLNKYGRQPDSKPEVQGDHSYLFESADLKNWTYLHEFYQSDRKWTDKSEDNMCASFMPLPNSADGGKFSGKHLLLFISHNKGCQYYVGSYANDKFKPDLHGRMTWKDNAYFAPEALIDSAGRQIMWSWIFDDRPEATRKFYGWTGTYGLPRSLWLGNDGTLRMAPVKELAALRQHERLKKNLMVKAGSELLLDGFDDELMELEITIQPGKADRVGVKVNCSADGREETSISYDITTQTLQVDATKSSIDLGRRNVESAPFSIDKAAMVVLRVFIDKSVIEVFANDKQAIGRSVYPRLGGRSVKLFANGADAKIVSVKGWEIMPTNPY